MDFDGKQLPALASDGTQIVQPIPFTQGFKTYFVGAGDQLSPLVRGGGQRIKLAWDANEARGQKVLTLQWAEPVEMHSGRGVYVGAWNLDDLLDLSILLPATVTASNGGGTGNCNRVPSGLGFDIIVPAAGNGAHDVVLANAVPIPAPDKDGYWDVDYDTGVVTPSAAPGEAAYHLMDLAIENYAMRRLSLGATSGALDVGQTYATQWVHPNWRVKVYVDKQSAGAGDFAGWLLIFRRSMTLG